MRNTGTTRWGIGVAPASNPIYLGAQNPQDNNIWGIGARSPQPSVAVDQNAVYTFTFNVIAPAAAGTYNFQWRMVQEYIAWFGGYSPNLSINVINGTPSLSGISISPYIKPNNTTQYNITVVGTDPSGGGNISHEYALINYQGGNAGNHRGYLTWYWGNPGWSGQIVCTGGGYASKQAEQPVYGSAYINLDACSTSVSGNTRTTVFTVRFTGFSTPATGNDISGYVHDGPSGNNTGWVNVDLNFGLAFAPSMSSATPNNTIILNSATSMTFTVTGYANANRIRFYIWGTDDTSQDDIICPTFSVTASSTPVTQTFTVPLTGQTNCYTGVANQVLETGNIAVHVYAFNPVDDPVAIGTAHKRVDPGNIAIDIPAGVTWTLTPPSGWTPPAPAPATWVAASSNYQGTGPITLNNVPFGSWTLTPQNRSGYSVQVTPSATQTLSY